MRAGGGGGGGEERVGVDHLVALVHAEVKVRRGVLRVAGVADEAEEIAGLHFHSFVEAGRPAVEVRVIKRRAVLRRQPEAVAAELLIADVADDAVGYGDDLRAFGREVVAPFVPAAAAVARRVPRVVEVARAHADDRHPQLRSLERREERLGALGELAVARDLGRGRRRDRRLAHDLAARVAAQVGAELRVQLRPVIVVRGRQRRGGRFRRRGRLDERQRRAPAEEKGSARQHAATRANPPPASAKSFHGLPERGAVYEVAVELVKSTVVNSSIRRTGTTSTSARISAAFDCGTSTRRKPSAAASRARRSACETPRTSPRRPTSPKSATSWPIGALRCDDSSAATTPRSMAGSVTCRRSEEHTP